MKLSHEPSLAQKFRQVVKGVNICTPTVLGYFELPNGVIEVSEGNMVGFTIYGARVATNNQYKIELSRLFASDDKLKDYCITLNEKLCTPQN